MVVTIRARYNGLFLEQHKTHNNIFQLLRYNTILHKLSLQTSCVTALVLSECTNSSYKAVWTALRRTAPNMINLDPLYVTQCTSSSSPRVNRQLSKYCTTTLSRTALNSITTSPPPGGRGGHHIDIGQWYQVLVHRILYDSLGTSETYFRIGNSSVVVNVVRSPSKVCCFFLLWFSSQENVTMWSA